MTQPSQSYSRAIRLNHSGYTTEGELISVFRRGEDPDVAILVEDGSGQLVEYVVSLGVAERLGLALIRESS